MTERAGGNVLYDAAERREIWRMDRDHFIHPYADLATFPDTGSHVIASGEGVHVTDVDGRSYIDGIAGLWCVNIGHGRTEMADAMAAQARRLQYYNPFGATTNVPAARLAARLAELAPGDLNHVFFSTGGSTANDIAIQFVHHYANRTGRPNKKKIISRLDAYHGATYMASTLSGIQATRPNFDQIGNFVTHISAANMYRRPPHLDEAGYCDFLAQEFEGKVLELGHDTVAAFIAEPVMGAGGVLVAPRGYHRRIHDLCRKYDILYIADEVVTGFGRLGHMFASEAEFDIVPDILCLAKGLTSGYVPLGATLFGERVYDVIRRPAENKILPRGYTYSGHAVACAAALVNIDIIERESLCDNVRNVAPYLHEQARPLLDIPIVGDVRGHGFMLGIEFVSDRLAKENFAPELGITQRIYEKCLARGLVVRPVGHVVVLSPPLILGRHHCDTMVQVLSESCQEVSRELGLNS